MEIMEQNTGKVHGSKILWTEEQEALLRELVAEDKHTIAELSEATGMSNWWVRVKTKEEKLKRTKMSAKGGKISEEHKQILRDKKGCKRTGWDEEREEILHRYLKEGKTTWEIAKLMNKRVGSVRRKCINEGLKFKNA